MTLPGAVMVHSALICCRRIKSLKQIMRSKLSADRGYQRQQSTSMWSCTNRAEPVVCFTTWAIINAMVGECHLSSASSQCFNKSCSYVMVSNIIHVLGLGKVMYWKSFAAQQTLSQVLSSSCYYFRLVFCIVATIAVVRFTWSFTLKAYFW